MKIKRLMITCKEATLYIERKEESAISFKEWIKLFVHLIICEFCRLFEKQNKFINLQLKHIHMKTSLSETEKAAMERSLRDEPNY